MQLSQKVKWVRTITIEIREKRTISLNIITHCAFTIFTISSFFTMPFIRKGFCLFKYLYSFNVFGEHSIFSALVNQMPQNCNKFLENFRWSKITWHCAVTLKGFLNWISFEKKPKIFCQLSHLTFQCKDFCQ